MKPSVKYGLIYAGISIGISLLAFGLGMEKDESVQKISSYINIALPAVIIFLGIRSQRDDAGNGFLSFGSGFGTGMTIAALGGLLTAAYTWLYFKILNPSMITFIKLKQEEELYKRGLSDGEVEKMSEQMGAWATPEMMSIFVFIGAVLLGLVISLISAGILKKENPNEII